MEESAKLVWFTYFRQRHRSSLYDDRGDGGLHRDAARFSAGESTCWAGLLVQTVIKGDGDVLCLPLLHFHQPVDAIASKHDLELASRASHIEAKFVKGDIAVCISVTTDCMHKALVHVL